MAGGALGPPLSIALHHSNVRFDRGAMLGVVRGPNAGNQLQAECIRPLLWQDDTNGDDKINEAAIQTLLHVDRCLLWVRTRCPIAQPWQR